MYSNDIFETTFFTKYKVCIQRAYFLHGLKLHVYSYNFFEKTSCHKVYIQIAFSIFFMNCSIFIQITFWRKLFFTKFAFKKLIFFMYTRLLFLKMSPKETRVKHNSADRGNNFNNFITLITLTTSYL